MLVAEAAQAAGVASGGATMGRPTCAILPESLQSGLATASFGCIGNRVYTGLGDDEGYYAIPGANIPEVVNKLAAIVEANRQLYHFHKDRAARSVRLLKNSASSVASKTAPRRHRERTPAGSSPRDFAGESLRGLVAQP